MSRNNRRAFTLVELLVVIGIIVLLMSILLPTLGRVRESGRSVKCMSNLRQLGFATAMYMNENNGYLPFPTTSSKALWFNALDPYLQTLKPNNRTGVAAEREYTVYKQCLVYDEFEGGNVVSGGQDKQKEFARTYKMNTHLRRPNNLGPIRAVEIRNSTEVAYIGDGISLDLTGPVDSQFESGEFSMEVNDPSQANPALRHLGGANMLFVDGHVDFQKLKSIEKNLRSPHNALKVKTWEKEFVDASGNPVKESSGTIPLATQKLKRNPNMPMIWSEPGKFHR